VDISAWLHRIGLEQYEPAFRANEIDARVLRSLTVDDLKDLGVSLVGHRRRLLDAIAALDAQSTAALTAVPHYAPPSGDAERRQLTVMFSDLVGSTELSVGLDPEDLREVISAYHRAVAGAIAGFDGFVAKYMGDGVLVYFGYPRAHEDDAERAVSAGLGIIDAVGRLDLKSLQLQVRVGIATGLVVVGDLIGEGSAQEQSVVGETPNLAARLQGLAEPGAVVIAAATRRLIGDLFELRELGVAELKGFSQAIQTWQVLGTSGVDNRFKALRSFALTPLVGRDDEIELLWRRWARAKTGEGQMVLVCGEPGIGKSRLLAVFEQRLEGEHHIRLHFFCSPHHQDSVFYPIIARIERAAGFARRDTPETRLDKLETLLSRSGESPPEERALFADLMGLPTAERYPSFNLDAQRKRELTMAAFVRQLEMTARQQPVFIIFDDIHWMDSTSLELLDAIAERVPQLPVLFCVTFRPEFQSPWTGQANVTMLSLSRLGQRDAAQLIARVAGEKELPGDLLDQIVRRADGIPLFAEELTKALLEGGLLHEQDGRYVLDSPLPTVEIPSSLYASLTARLDRLSPVKEVAQIGAAVGREFSYELIAALARRTDAQLGDALEQLVSSGLVFRRGTPPNQSFVFKHALVQDAAYNSLLRRQRQELHARIGKVLETRFPEIVGTQPEIIAYHYTRAGLSEPAIEYWRRAGERALRRSGNVEGVAHLTRAIELIQSLPPNNDRDRKELELHLSLGQMMRATEGYAAPETLRTFARARELLDKRATVNERTTVLYGLWSVHYVRAEHVAAREVTLQCLQLAEEHQNSDAPALANMLMGCSLWAMGDFVHSRHHLELAQGVSGVTKVSRFSNNNAIAALSYLSWTLWPLGYPNQALAAASEAIRRARHTDHVPLTAYALFTEAFLATAFRAEGGSLRTRADDAVAYCIEHRVTAYEHWARFCQALALAQSDDPRDAIDKMRDAMGAAEKISAVFLRPLHLGHLASAYMNIGQPEVALALLDEAITIALKSEERFFSAELHRLRGEALLQIGGEGEGELQLALAVARQQQAKLWELRAVMSLARLRGGQDRRAEAHGLLAPVCGWFTEGLGTPDLKDAKALLDTLEA
jgi:class 3 adenylate cyclase/predicted ATPase